MSMAEFDVLPVHGRGEQGNANRAMPASVAIETDRRVAVIVSHADLLAWQFYLTNMSQLRDEIFDWIATGHLKPEDVPRAFAAAGLTPTRLDWRNFLDALLLWTGVVLVASGVIFFFAYNWQSLHRFGKFALVETVFAAALIAVWRYGTERAAGKAALTGAALLTGAMLALVRQTYQTGADTFELFAVWAAFILPWVIAARFAPLWLLWIGLINLCVWAYFQALAWGVLGLLFGVRGILWVLFGVNLVATIAWEFGLACGIAWLHRWGARALATLTGVFATSIGVLAVVDSNEIGTGAILAYIAWILAMYAYYRLRVFDVFMLAGALLSAIVFITAFLGKQLLSHGEAGGFLLIALVVIGMSAAGAWWIRQMLQEQPR